MDEAGWYQRSHLFFVIVVAVAGLIYLFSNSHPQNHYDYTLRIAECLLHGQTGFRESPPRWLNEFVPIDGAYFSVFSLGAAAGESCAVAANSVMTLVFWFHGNSGGWQFGYRYAMVLLPWIFILLLETSHKPWARWNCERMVFHLW